MNRFTKEPGYRATEVMPPLDEAFDASCVRAGKSDVGPSHGTPGNGQRSIRVRVQLGERDKELRRGIERAASELGWEIHHGGQLTGARMDGLITNEAQPGKLDVTHPTSLPTVVVASTRAIVRPHQIDGSITISPDLHQAGKMAAHHLLSLGLPHLAFFTSCPDHWSESVAKGFSQACSETRVTPRLVPAPDGNPSQRAEQLLSHLDGLPLPCAILADHDRHAIEIIAAAHHLGLRVPEDLAVMGVGNLEALQERSIVPFSSIELGLEQLGYLAACQLDRIVQGCPAVGSLLLPPQGLVIRKSTSPALSQFPGIIKAVEIVQTAYAGDLSVPSIARQCGMSVRNLHRLYRSITGSTIGKDIVRLRIEEAKRKLMLESQPLDPIAAAVGLGNSRNLCRLFKKHLGLTPGQWRSVHLHPSLTGAA